MLKLLEELKKSGYDGGYTQLTEDRRSSLLFVFNYRIQKTKISLASSCRSRTRKFSSQIKPISYSKKHTAEIVKDISENRESLLIAQNEGAKHVIMDVNGTGRVPWCRGCI